LHDDVITTSRAKEGAVLFQWRVVVVVVCNCLPFSGALLDDAPPSNRHCTDVNYFSQHRFLSAHPRRRDAMRKTSIYR